MERLTKQREQLYVVIEKLDSVRLLIAYSQAESNTATCDEWFDIVVEPGLQESACVREQLETRALISHLTKAEAGFRPWDWRQKETAVAFAVYLQQAFDLMHTCELPVKYTLTERQTPVGLLCQFQPIMTAQKTMLTQSVDAVIEACIVHSDLELLQQLLSNGAQVQAQTLKRSISKCGNSSTPDWPAFTIAFDACEQINNPPVIGALFNQSLKSNNTAAWKIVFSSRAASDEELNQMLLSVIQTMLSCEGEESLQRSYVTAQFLLTYIPDVNKAFDNLKTHTSLLQFVVQTQAHSELTRTRCLELLTEAGAWVNREASGIEWCRSFCKLMRGRYIAHQIVTKIMQNSIIDLRALSLAEAAQVLSECIRFRHFHFLTFLLSILPTALPKISAEEIQTLVQASETENLKSLKVQLRSFPVLSWSCEETCSVFLIREGADVNLSDTSGNRPLHVHSSAGHVALVELLLNHKALIDSKRTKDLNTPLHVACQNDRKTVAEILIRSKADVSISNARGKVALQLLADRERRAHLQQLAALLTPSVGERSLRPQKEKKVRSHKDNSVACEATEQFHTMSMKSENSQKSNKAGLQHVTPLTSILETEIDALCAKVSAIDDSLVIEALKKEVCMRSCSVHWLCHDVCWQESLCPVCSRHISACICSQTYKLKRSAVTVSECGVPDSFGVESVVIVIST